MNTAKRMASAVVMTVLASGAMAADISSADTPLNLGGGSAVYGHAIDAGNGSANFSDTYSFTVSAGTSVYADVFSSAASDNSGLDISGLSLYNAGGLVASGTQVLTGATDQWKLNSSALSAGSYYLLVVGSVDSAAAAGYTGTATATPAAVSAVPEPATYGMLLGGLALIGAVARRRKQSDAA